jgi:hypothetical protein
LLACSAGELDKGWQLMWLELNLKRTGETVLPWTMDVSYSDWLINFNVGADI